MTIEFKCPRCMTSLRVPDSKAGRKGRCPICGARLTIPEPDPSVLRALARPHLPRTRVTWAVVVAGSVLVAVCILIAVSGHHRSRANEGDAGLSLTPEQQARVEQPLAQISRMEEMVRKYRELRVEERHLRAREVLMKINGYAPVSDYEFALRAQAMEEEKAAAKSGGDAGGESHPWKLSTPLEPSEKEKLDRLSNDLKAQSAELERGLGLIGILVASAKDPLGRALLDGAEVSAQLAARRETIVKEVLGSPVREELPVKEPPKSPVPAQQLPVRPAAPAEQFPPGPAHSDNE